MVIVDTTVWVDYFRGVDAPQTDWLDRRLGTQRLGLTDLNLCEVLQGVAGEDQAARVRRELLAFELFSTGGAELAVNAARNFRTLRRNGFTVRKTIDCLIATFCISNGHSLLHSDRDFDVFERELGLSVVPV